jgi:hypothetical protein
MIEKDFGICDFCDFNIRRYVVKVAHFRGFRYCLKHITQLADEANRLKEEFESYQTK